MTTRSAQTLKLVLSENGKWKRTIQQALVAGAAAGLSLVPFAANAADTDSSSQASTKDAKKKKAAEADSSSDSMMVAQAGTPPAAPAPDSTAPADKNATQLETVEVTGSRIKAEKLTNTSSLQTINREEFQLGGVTNVESLINQMPQTFAEMTEQASNGATGTATVDLRGLGAIRTLVLIDGKRLMPGDPTGKNTSGSSPDLNFIPAQLVDRVELLSGGASAVYGSDAIAGVVNFHMKRNFEGMTLDAEQSKTDHGDGKTDNYTFVMGTNFADGQGNVVFYAGLRKLDAILQGAREFSACAVTTKTAGTAHTCGGSGNIPEGLFIGYSSPGYGGGAPGPYGASGYYMPDPTGATRTFVPYDGRTFNYAPFNYLQRPDKTYSLGAFAHRQFSRSVDVYADAMFMDDHTVAQLAATPVGFRALNVNCDNPLLSDQEAAALGCSVGPRSTNDVTFLLGRRMNEIGARDDDLRHTDFRLNLGVRGDFLDAWSYDLSMQRGEVIFNDSTQHDLSLGRMQNALEVDPSGVCKSVINKTDTNCVPLDLFQVGAMTPAQVAYISAAGFQRGDSIEQILLGTVTGDLGQYGLKSPLAANGIGVAVGAEHRNESLDLSVDDATRLNELPGFGQTVPITGHFQVNEVFGELHLPIISDMPLIKALDVDGAYRNSKYSTAGVVNTYKAGLNWAPISDVSVRGSYQRATRAPSTVELFSPLQNSLFGGHDPCSGTTPDQTLAQCANSGVTAAQYGGPGGTSPTGIGDCISGQCNAVFGGNIALRPENSDTRSIGLVLTPTFMKGFSATIDWFDIRVNNAISVVGAQTLLDECGITGNPAFCSQIHRGPTGTLWGPPANYVNQTSVNIGSLATRGIDFGVDQRLHLADVGLAGGGMVAVSFVGTWLNALETQSAPGLPTFDCVGQFGITCGAPNPKWKHKMRAAWETPVTGLTVSAAWRHIGAASLDKNGPDPQLTTGSLNTIDGEITARDYLDVGSTWATPFNKDLVLRAGVSNVGNQGPPIVSSNDPNPISVPPFGNANTFPGVYDSLGRVFFVGLSLNVY